MERVRGMDAKYVVRLTDDERTILEALVKAPRVARRRASQRRGRFVGTERERKCVCTGI